MTYVIMLNWNNLPDSLECMNSILELEGAEYKTIIIDNGSTDDSLEGILGYLSKRQIEHGIISGSDAASAKLSENCIVIKSGKNLGYGGGNNLGLKYALNQDDFRHAWIINNDLIFERNTLVKLIAKYEALSQKKKTGLMACKLKSYYDRSRIQTIGSKYNYYFCTNSIKGAWEPDAGQYDRDDIEDVIDCPAGASLFASKAFLKDCGLISEEYFLYYEEIDWIMRSRSKGWELGYCWEAEIYHKEGATTGASSVKESQKSSISDYYMARARILFARKFFPNRLVSVYLGFGITILKRIARLQFNRIPMIISLMYKGALGKL